MAHTSKFVKLLMTGVCLLPVACHMFDRRTLIVMPEDPAEDATWWAKLPRRMPPNLRAVYVAASDAHIAKGTSAVYRGRYAYISMASGTSYAMELPCPPPPEVLAEMRSRVRPGDFDRGQSLPGVEVDASVRCRPAEARAIWRTAFKSVYPSERWPIDADITKTPAPAILEGPE